MSEFGDNASSVGRSSVGSAPGGWTLDVEPLRGFAMSFLRPEDAPGQGVKRLATNVLTLCAEIETMREIDASHWRERQRLQQAAEELRALLIKADSAISHLHHRGEWPLDRFETDRLIGRLREAGKS